MAFNLNTQFKKVSRQVTSRSAFCDESCIYSSHRRYIARFVRMKKQLFSLTDFYPAPSRIIFCVSRCFAQVLQTRHLFTPIVDRIMESLLWWITIASRQKKCDYHSSCSKRSCTMQSGRLRTSLGFRSWILYNPLGRYPGCYQQVKSGDVADSCLNTWGCLLTCRDHGFPAVPRLHDVKLRSMERHKRSDPSETPLPSVGTVVERLLKDFAARPNRTSPRQYAVGCQLAK